jgi:hypothetical protein
MSFVLHAPGRWLTGTLLALGCLIACPVAQADDGRGRSYRPSAAPTPPRTEPSSVSGSENSGDRSSDPSPLPADATAGITYSGRATALRIDDVQEPLPGPIIVADTGPLPSGGGLREASKVDYQLLGADGVTVAVGIELAQASVSGSGNLTMADTTLTGFHVTIQTPAGEIFPIDADYAAASASAALATNGNGEVDSSVTIENLRVAGQPVLISGKPNQVVPVPGGQIVIHERTSSTGSGRAQITVAPFHFYIEGCMNGVVGAVAAGIAGSGGPVEEHECGKLTGGGWIAGPSGAKSTFAVSGGIRRGLPWGHLNYIDHAAGLKVQSTSVVSFEPNPNVPDCRIIKYGVMINGLPGTATVDAWDRGEPGRRDYFSITLSTGYTAKGTLGGEDPGGGNLQLHKCPPGWEK